MAFTVKVDVKHRDSGQAQVRQVDAAKPLVGLSDATSSLEDSIPFSAGNPRVEHITGVVHLYRDVPAADLAQRPAWTQPVRSAAWQRSAQPCGGCLWHSHPDAAAGHKLTDVQESHREILAVLAVSPDMGVADFCTWTGGYLPSIRDLRFVHRDDSRTSCLVLLRFDTAATAAAFHKEHNNKPVSVTPVSHADGARSAPCIHCELVKACTRNAWCVQFWTLEPDVICRLVFIKDVQYDEGSSRGGSTAPPAAVMQIAAAAASSSREGSPGASSSAAGQMTAAGGSSSQLQMPGLTELPTCPVCLERLDAHISGIVTTVRRHLAASP